MVKISFFGAFAGITKFIIAHWYWIILILVLIPTIITSISVAKETDNPSYPFIVLGLRLANADHVIYEDVQTLKENPSEFIGMEKPTEGLWNAVKYWWSWFWKVFMRFATNIWLIAFPFVVFYKFFRMRNTSAPAKNIFLALIIGIIFIFLINSFLTIYEVVKGTLEVSLPTGAGMFQEVWHIIKLVLPFHGVSALVVHLFSLV